MRILFRADSGAHIGSGHVRRCLTLASFLQESGHSITFVSREHFGNINQEIQNRFKLISLPHGVKESQKTTEQDYLSWLGVDLGEEINDFSQILASENYDVVVIDHYALDFRFEEKCAGAKVVVIDDLASREHRCDILLNQNLGGSRFPYIDLNRNKICKYLIGPSYALLGKEFEKRRPKLLPKPKKIENILVFFGGVDITRESRKVVDAFLAMSTPFRLKIILNHGHEDYSYIQSLADSNHLITLKSFEEDMAKAISESDLCFGAAGTSSYERACVGTPSYVILAAENQRSVLNAFVKENAAICVGMGQETTKLDWQNVFREIPTNSTIDKVRMNSYNICDGLGAFRVVKEIELVNV